MPSIAEVIEQVRSRPEVPEGETANPFRLVSSVADGAAPAELADVEDDELRELWGCCRTARLFEDADHGQWGLVLLDPDAAASRTEQERARRPDDLRAGDVVVGEFLGDQDLVVLAPSGQGDARVLVALPLDAREDWWPVGASLADFLARYVAAAGEKFWEAAPDSPRARDSRLTLASAAAFVGVGGPPASVRDGMAMRRLVLPALLACTTLAPPPAVGAPPGRELPAGVTTLAAPIVLRSGDVLRGKGIGQSVLAPAAGYTGPLVVSSGDRSAGVTIRDLTLDGRGRTGVAMQLTGVSDLAVRDVEVLGTTRTGIEASGPGGGPAAVRQNWANVTVRDCRGTGLVNRENTSGAAYDHITVHRCGSGMVIAHPGARLAGIQVVNNAAGDGLRITDAPGLSLTNLRAIGNGASGVHVSGSGGSSGRAWLVNNNRVNDVWFEGSARGWRLAGVLVGHDPCQLGDFDDGSERGWRVDSGASVSTVGLRVLPKAPQPSGCRPALADRDPQVRRVAGAAARVIRFGPGTHLVSRMIVVPDGALLQGAGMGVTILKAAPGFTGTMIASAAGRVHHPGIGIRDLSVNGDGSAERGIHVIAADDLVIQNVEVSRTTGTAIEQRGIAGQPFVERQTWENVRVRDCGGWGVYNGLRTRKVNYTKVTVSGCARGGMTIDHSEAQALGIVLSRNGGHGLWVRNVFAVDLTGITATGNDGAGIYVQGGVFSLGADWTALNNGRADVWFTNLAPQPSFSYGVTRGSLVAGMLVGHADCDLGDHDDGAEPPLTIEPRVDVQIVGKRLAGPDTPCPSAP